MIRVEYMGKLLGYMDKYDTDLCLGGWDNLTNDQWLEIQDTYQKLFNIDDMLDFVDEAHG
jgi:hypothetical protein